MKSRKPQDDDSERWVWRISQSAPLGEWVDLKARPPKPPQTALPEVETSGGWIVSSFDLLRGVEIEESPDTVPMEYFDELFPRTGTDGER